MRQFSDGSGNTSKFSFSINGFRIVLALFLLFTLGRALAAQEPEFVSICNSCSSNQDFARAAVREAPDPRPGDARARIYPVYVVSTRRAQVEFFNVHVYREEGGISPFSTTNYSLGVVKTAYPAAPHPTIASAVLDAALIAEAFTSTLNDNIRADDITSVGSAVDLVGPYESRAGYRRNQIKMDINDYYNSVWKQLVTNFSDLTSRLGAKFFGSNGVFRVDGFAVIEFSDGTTIRIRVDEILEGIDSDDAFAFEMTVVQHTARLPDGSPVPNNAAHFSGFSWSDGPTGPSLAQRLARLAGLYGLGVGDSGDALDCTMTCDTQGHCDLSCS